MSLTVAQAALAGSCDKDAEDPTCAKVLLSQHCCCTAQAFSSQAWVLQVTILGTLEPVEGEADIGEAQQLLFLRHPEMRGWPAGHNFRL